MSRVDEITAALLGAILTLGLFCSWVEARWARGAFEFLLLVLAASWLAYSAVTKRKLRLPMAFAPLAGMVLLAGGQVAAGWTISAWHTSEAALDWLARLAAALLVVGALGRQAGPRFRRGLTLAGTLVAALGLAQAMTGSGRVFWIFHSGFTGGVFGPFVYHNKFAQFLELVFPLALCEAVTARRRHGLWWAAVGLEAAAMAATASRAGFALLLAEMLAVILLLHRHKRFPGRAAWAAGGAAAAVFAGGTLLAGWKPLGDRLLYWDVRQDLRVPVLESSLALARSHLWRGTGLGTWAIAYPEAATFDNGLRVNQAHNDWIQWAIEGGLPAAGLMIAFLTLVLPAAIRTVWGVGGPVVLLNALVDYPMQQVPAFGVLVVVAAMLPLAAARWGDAEPCGP